MKNALITHSKIITILHNVSICCEFTEQDWETAIRVLRHDGLLARTSFQLEKQGLVNNLPHYAQKHLSNAAKLAEKQHSSVVYECNQITKSTNKTATKFYLLKGAAYVFCRNNTSLGRTFGDIDLLVDKSQISRIEGTLLLHGWLHDDLDDYDNTYYRQWAHEIPPLKHASRGSVIDLHHNLVPPVSGRAPKIELFTENAIAFDDFYVLRPAAMTLHSIVHLFFNEEFPHGLRDLNDIHLLITQYESDSFWQDIYTLATASGFTIELYLACRYSQRFFQTNIPEKITIKLEETRTNRLSILFWDFIFSRVLDTKHPMYATWTKSFAIFIALVRGHYLKMPLPILIRHGLHKSYRELVRLFLGKSFFSKEETPH